MLDNRLRKLAIDAMDRLMSHPISSPFLNSLKPEEAPPNYSEMMKNPVSLSGIREGLLEGKYTRVQSWFEAMELCWRNFDSLRTGDSTKVSLFEGVTGELRRLFGKEKRLFTEPEVDHWFSEVSERQKKVKGLMAGAAAYAEQRDRVRVTTSDGRVLDGFNRIKEISTELQERLHIRENHNGETCGLVVCYKNHSVAIADLENHISDILWQKTDECLNCLCTWLQSLKTDSQSTIDSIEMRYALEWLHSVLKDVKGCHNYSELHVVENAIEILCGDV
jgi:hypothetical protein